MVKGCQKRTIHIRDTGSKYYEEAYFVLRPGVSDSKVPELDMINEAVRIAGESIGAGADPVRRRRRGDMISFLLGLLSGGALCAVLILIFLL